jgi:predicted RNA-binding Zn-ribbon protein involved in translation (DUF1610 family)
MLYLFNNLIYKIFVRDPEICPTCGSELERVHRNRRDRLLCFFSGLKLRRFVCPECGQEHLLLVYRNWY